MLNNIHPKVAAGALGAVVLGIAGAGIDALIAQCGGQQGIINALIPVVTATIGSLAAGYARPTGNWTPAPAAPPAPPAPPPAAA